MKQIVFAIFLVLMNSGQLGAVGGGDDLMKALGTTEDGQGFDRSRFQLSDSFSQEFFIAFSAEKQLPLEVRQWGLKILNGHYAEAAHVWTAIQKYLPPHFEVPARVAHLYCLWKLDLPQTFLNAWLEAIHAKDFRSGRLELALERTIAVGFDQWLLEAAVTLSPDQRVFVDKLDVGEVDPTLRAYAALRRGMVGLPLLDRIPSENAMKLPLAETVILALARAGDLPKAAMVLKQHLEPALAQKKDPLLLAEHYIQIARLLYQAGVMDGAAAYYQKIPRGADSFLDAREELTWVWLRQGDISHLRGELTTLKSPIYANRFGPELYLVRAISDLKLCFYDEVQKDFKDFVSQNSQWAQAISAALKTENPPAPPEKDFYTRWLERAVVKRQGEVAHLKRLAEESIGASLPAVGFQMHWQKALATAEALLGSLEKSKADEYRRQWRNRQSLMVESIRKMQFVRVEVLSQMNDLAKLEMGQGDQKSVALLKTAADEAKKLNKEGEMVFPFDGVYWPDELFKLRSVTNGVCVRR